MLHKQMKERFMSSVKPLFILYQTSQTGETEAVRRELGRHKTVKIFYGCSQSREFIQSRRNIFTILRKSKCWIDIEINEMNGLLYNSFRMNCMGLNCFWSLSLGLKKFAS